MDPRTLSRRQLLGAIGGTLGVSGVVGATAPVEWLPDPVVRARLSTVRAPEPDWRPPVTEAHVRASREQLRDEIAATEPLVDALENPSETRQGRAPAGTLASAKETLAETEDAPADWRTLGNLLRAKRELGYGHGEAARRLDRIDADGLRDRGVELERRIRETARELTYEVGDPEVGLAYLYAVERRLALAGLNTYVDGTYIGGRRTAPEIDDYDDYIYAGTMAAHHEGRHYHLDAKQLRRTYANRRGEPTVDREGNLRDALRMHVENVNANRVSFDDRPAFAESGQDDAFQEVQFRYWQFTHGDANLYRDRGPWRHLLHYRTMHAVRSAVKIDAYELVMADRLLEPGDTVDLAMVHEAKRRAAAAARQIYDDGGPFTTVALDEVTTLFMDARLGVEFGPGPSRNTPRERAQAFADYRLARAHCEAFESY